MQIGNIPTSAVVLFLSALACGAVQWYAILKMHAEVSRTGGIQRSNLTELSPALYQEYRRRFPDSRLPQLRVVAAWVGFVLGVLAVIVTLVFAE
jgi:hypothetical protein